VPTGAPRGRGRRRRAGDALVAVVLVELAELEVGVELLVALPDVALWVAPPHPATARARAAPRTMHRGLTTMAQHT
jgi:hypothetical protein